MKMYHALSSRRLQCEDIDKELFEILTEVAKVFGESEPSLLHVLWLLRDGLERGFGRYGDDVSINLPKPTSFGPLVKNLVKFDLLRRDDYEKLVFSPDGRSFILRLDIRLENRKAEKYHYTVDQGGQIDVSSFWWNSGLRQ